MDPITGIGLAASVGQILSQVFQIFTNVYRYYRVVHDAPRFSADLRLELDSLIDILSSTQEVFQSNPQDTFNSSLTATLSDLTKLLNRLESRIVPSETQGFRRLRWPFQLLKFLTMPNAKIKALRTRNYQVVQDSV